MGLYRYSYFKDGRWLVTTVFMSDVAYNAEPIKDPANHSRKISVKEEALRAWAYPISDNGSFVLEPVPTPPRWFYDCDHGDEHRDPPVNISPPKESNEQ